MVFIPPAPFLRVLNFAQLSKLLIIFNLFKGGIFTDFVLRILGFVGTSKFSFVSEV
jgi:hypothetical protein